jgi:5-methyltetrahydrofolate--homocysteine methyltransferase
MTRAARIAALDAKARTEILILDGAMGTQIQDLKLDESGYRGARFAGWHVPVQGNNDILNLSAPEAVQAIHQAYFDAGADIVDHCPS